jgi:methionyl-tRNA formyltransferase
LNGDAETGITTMPTDAGVDTGPVLLNEKIKIPSDMYYAELHDMLAELGAAVLKRTIPAFIAGKILPVPQDEGRATYAPIIQKSEGALDFTRDAVRLVNTVRAFSVWPGAAAYVKGKMIKIHRAETGGAFGAAAGPATGTSAGTPGDVVRLDRNALSILCGDNNLFNVTRLQFLNGRIMDISECWHNL